MSNLTSHAETELKLAGVFNKDSEYNGMLGHAALELIKVFAKQGHSGFSAQLTMELFQRLGSYKTLTPITNKSDEWNDVSEMSAGPWWQNTRDHSAFSHDGGKTHWLLDDVEKRQREVSYKIKKFLFGLVGVSTRAYKDVMKRTPDAENTKAKA